MLSEVDWPAEKQAEVQKIKLDEHFLRNKLLPSHQSLSFFPDLHTEVSRSWRKPFSAHLFIPTSDYYGNVWMRLQSDASGRADACKLSVSRRGIVSEGSGLALQAAAHDISADGQGVHGSRSG